MKDVITDTFLTPFKRKKKQSNILYALKNLTFSILEGDLVGIIGPNGSGKTTLLKILSRITYPSQGSVTIKGKVGTLLEVGAGFHLELSGRENIFLNGAILGMHSSEIKKKFDAIVAFSEIERFIDTQVKYYSSGMYMKLAFAVAAHLETDIVLVDEVLAVGDAAFQKKCLGKMSQIATDGRTIIFVSHNMSAIRKLCNRCLWFDKGEIVQDSVPEKVINSYMSVSMTLPPEKQWPEQEPQNNDYIKLISVRVVNEAGNTIDTADINKPVGIEIRYKRLDKYIPFLACHFINAEGIAMFGSHDFEYRAQNFDCKLDYDHIVSETCIIPQNLLSEGLVIVNISLCSFTPVFTEYATYKDVVAFEAVDLCDISEKTVSTAKWPGVVRPSLKWNIVDCGHCGLA